MTHRRLPVAGRGRIVLGAAACALIVGSATGCGGSSTTSTSTDSAAASSSATSDAPSSSVSVPTATGLGSYSPPTPAVDPVNRPPYVDHVEWVSTAVGPSLQIHPTVSGRKTYSDDGADVAWAEVLKLAPDADTPGMRAQFDCHWTYARLVAPDKPSWNIEPQRPVVDEQQMVATRCNPGGPEE
ncbi:DUF2599 domain-containing protein [Gordonia sp. NPDC003504]